MARIAKKTLGTKTGKKRLASILIAEAESAKHRFVAETAGWVYWSMFADEMI